MNAAAYLKHSLNTSTIIGVTTSQLSSGQWGEKQVGNGRDWDLFLCVRHSFHRHQCNVMRHLWLHFCQRDLCCARANLTGLIATWLIIGACGSCVRSYSVCLDTHCEPEASQTFLTFQLDLLWLCEICSKFTRGKKKCWCHHCQAREQFRWPRTYSRKGRQENVKGVETE